MICEIEIRWEAAEKDIEALSKKEVNLKKR